MGAGIAVAMLDAGMPVTMIERDDTQLARGRANVEKVYDGLIKKGRMTPEAKAAVMARFNGLHQLRRAGQVDIVVEAVFEDMAVKKAVFAELDRVCKKGACWPPTPRTSTSTRSRPASRARRTWWACTSSRRPTS
jgi:3-hydroxyacyl-CoA dehydrogenase